MLIAISCQVKLTPGIYLNKPVDTWKITEVAKATTLPGVSQFVLDGVAHVAETVAVLLEEHIFPAQGNERESLAPRSSAL